MEIVAKCLLVLAMIFIASVNSSDAYTTPSPPPVCNVTLDELAKCLPAITGKSPPKPTKDCCNALCKADLHCLCNRKSELSKFVANPEKAMQLPQKCGRKLPSECKVHH